MTRNDDQTLTMMALALTARTIQLRCRDCGHGRSLDPVDLAASYGDGLAVGLLSKRATCTKCGSRRHTLFVTPPKA
jgi:DNA-directed RNA polymerase subunit RPC12/RpoP